MFVIAGVTGHTGSEVATALLERKQPVRVIVRTSEKGAAWLEKGAEVAVASMDDAQAMAKALDGATGAYLLLPPNHKASHYLDDQKKIADALAAAVQSSGIPHVVLLSSIGAHLPGGTGVILSLHDAERRLGAVARNMTALRAATFIENWLEVLDAARTKGILPSFLSPGRKIPMVATRDIGRMAAECLLDRCKGKRVLELSGPEDYSPKDVAETIGRRLDRTVAVQQAPLSAAVPTLTSLGFSEDVARLFEEMYAGVEKGHVTFEQNGAAHARGVVTLAEAVKGWM